MSQPENVAMMRRGLPRVAGGEPWPAEQPVPEWFHGAVSAVESTSDDGGAGAVGAERVAEPDAAVPSEPETTEAVDTVAPADTPEPVEVPDAGETAGAGETVALRRGLPRVAGGEPWPPEGQAVLSAPMSVGTASAQPVAHSESPAAPSAPVEAPEEVAEPEADASAGTTDAPEASTSETPVAAPVASAPAEQGAASSGETVSLRRGLPRVKGGEPWPPEGVATVAAPAVGAAASSSVSVAEPETAEPVAESVAPAKEPVAKAPATEETPAAASPAVAKTTEASDVPLRRGLARVKGGEPWPPKGMAPAWAILTPGAPVAPASDNGAEAQSAEVPAAEPVAQESEPVAEKQPEQAEAKEPATEQTVEEQRVKKQPVAVPPKKPTEQKPAESKPVAPKADAKPKKDAQPQQKKSESKPEPKKYGKHTIGGWIGLGIAALVGIIIVAGILVLAARGVTTLPGAQEWFEKYPGEYEPAVAADEGFPWWLRWSHFFNFFLMALIIRTGILVRKQQKPDAFYTPKRGGKKVSIYLWLHTSVDVLWLLNGVIFVVLLFATGHWARLVPTSWEVFPNAVSAGIQYVSLDWPTHDGWFGYNALQQLTYFVVIFIAAPLAAITGFRMSEWWPNKPALNKLVPAEAARAIHFPTMVFFVIFIIGHVALVFANGALQNLNYMFAGRQEVNWVGFWWFVVAIALTAAVVAAARPLVIAPIANLFGKVSNR